MNATLKLGEHYILDLFSCSIGKDLLPRLHDLKELLGADNFSMRKLERAAEVHHKELPKNVWKLPTNLAPAAVPSIDSPFVPRTPAARRPSRPGGGIGFMYVSDTPWENGLKTPYPPGVNHYINPEVHRAAFGLPEFFRKELYGG